MADSDDRDFDALLKDHAKVRAAYRAASVGEQPPESLDAAILAASRRAVNAGPGSVDRSRRFVSRMAVPLSAAAVMVLATSLSFLVYEERGTPSAPGPSRAVPAPTPGAATADHADKAAEALAPAAPAGVPIELSQSESKSELREKTPLRVAPSAGNTESVRPAPVAAPPVRGPQPSQAAPSEVVADAVAPSAEMPGARQEREALAARYSETASERSAFRNEVQESLAQAESARAVSAGQATERAAQARQADRPSRQLGAREEEGAESPPAASMPADAPAATSAKRLASPARDRAMESAARAETRPKTALSPEDTPAVWIGRVRALMDAGQLDAARAEVARLRCRHPDVTLPADLPAPKVWHGVPCACR